MGILGDFVRRLHGCWTKIHSITVFEDDALMCLETTDKRLYDMRVMMSAVAVFDASRTDPYCEIVVRFVIMDFSDVIMIGKTKLARA